MRKFNRDGDQMVLVVQGNWREVQAEEMLLSFRGEIARLDDAFPPEEQGKTGRVQVHIEGASMPIMYYPSVYGLEWVYFDRWEGEQNVQSNAGSNLSDSGDAPGKPEGPHSSGGVHEPVSLCRGPEKGEEPELSDTREGMCAEDKEIEIDN